METKDKKELTSYFIEAYGTSSDTLKKYIHESVLEFIKNADGPDCVDYWKYREYFCNIQLTNGDTLIEMDLDSGHEAAEVLIYAIICGPNDCYSRELSQLSIEDQLTILNTIYE